MSKIQIDASEQKEYRNQVKEEWKRLKNVTAEEKDLVEEFLGKFGDCEIVYKKALGLYNRHKPSNQCKTQDKKSKSNKSSKRYDIINITQVKAALELLGYNFEESFLEKLFASNDNNTRKIGKNLNGITVKTLRNKLTHERNQKYIDKLEQDKDNFYDIMDQFLNIIETFDN